MSIERLLTAKATPSRGDQPAPTQEQIAVTREVAGGKPAIRDLGHREHGQTMHRHMELRTRSYTSEVRGDGRVAPGETASLVQKATGNMSISLVKPPEVPVEQRSVSGKSRRQTWSTELWIYHAGNATISWPDGVKWGTGGQPANPRPQGTADVFGVRYITSSGEWWVFPLAVGVIASEPTDTPVTAPPAPGPEAGTPTDPEDDDGAPDLGSNPPEHEYVNPETGDALEQERPEPQTGILLALHDAAISISPDVGSAWRIVPGPVGARQMSALNAGGIIVTTDAGTAIYSSNVRSWTLIQLEDEIVEEVQLENADFEYGALEPWERAGLATPAVSDSSSPPQLPGSGYYLARNPAAAGGGSFLVEQRVELEPAGRTVRVTADVYRDMGAVGELTLIAPGGDAGFVGFGWKRVNLYADDVSRIGITGGDFEVPRSIRSTDGRVIRSVWSIVDIQGWFARRVDLYGGGRMGFNLPDQPQRDTVFEVTFPEPVSGEVVVSGMRVNNGVSDRIWFASADQGQVTVRRESGFLTISSGAEATRWHAQEPSSIRVKLTNCAKFRWGYWGYRGGSDITFTASLADREHTVYSDSQADGWHRISTEIPEAPAGDYRVRVGGRGAPANVFFDNVRLEYVTKRNEYVMGVCRDLASRRHLISTASSIHAHDSSGVRYLCPSPMPSPVVAAHGDIIALGDTGGVVHISRDNGGSFERVEFDAIVLQLLAYPELLAVRGDGVVTALRETGPVDVAHLEQASTLVYAERYKRWIATSLNGAVTHSTDLKTWQPFKAQPAGGERWRKTLPTASGRLIGYGLNGRDLFWTDAPADGWSVGYSLTAPIINMTELL